MNAVGSYRYLLLFPFHLILGTADAQPVTGYPFLEAVRNSGVELSAGTADWMKKWKGMDLEELGYLLNELSGSTSINLKIRKLDPSDPDGSKSRGTFVPRNGAANPDTEVAYFNLAALLGCDEVFRPAAVYDLGPKASARFKALMRSTPIRGSHRVANKNRILAQIAQGQPLRGCIKAKKSVSAVSYDAIGKGRPDPRNAVIKALQASSPQPKAGTSIELKSGYRGDALTVAREYSIMMTFDAIFQQWDRYSGGNVVIFKDEAGVAHFYANDNGGAYVSKTTTWVERNLSRFSRYDRSAIQKLREMRAFLRDESKDFLGYKTASEFILDLGLRTELTPSEYVKRLERNLNLLIMRVEEMERRYKEQAYFE